MGTQSRQNASSPTTVGGLEETIPGAALALMMGEVPHPGPAPMAERPQRFIPEPGILIASVCWLGATAITVCRSRQGRREVCGASLEWSRSELFLNVQLEAVSTKGNYLSADLVLDNSKRKFSESQDVF